MKNSLIFKLKGVVTLPISATGTSHAKIILIGEHSVVYHQPAIALPLPAVKTTVTITERSGNQQWLISRYFSGNRSDAPIQLNGINHLLDVLLTRFNHSQAGFTLKIRSQLPAERGMGSSAATAVAIIRALYDYFKLPLTHEQLLLDADISEHIIHGNPSGLDVATASASAPVWFVTGDTPTSLPFHLDGYMIIADSGIYGQTGSAVANVAKTLSHHPRRGKHLIEELGELTKDAKDALGHNAIQKLGTILDAAQVQLKALGVSHPTLDKLIRIAKANGALGAKLTGGGMGGCMICLVENVNVAKRVKQALIDAGAAATWVQPLLSEELADETDNVTR